MIGIIDYGAGNTASVANALKKNNSDYIISSNVKEIENCYKLILPGVGQAEYAINKLKESGLYNYLKKTSKPVLGICLGMQILADYLEEGNTTGLGIFNNNCYKFSGDIKIPHMGWNIVKVISDDCLFVNIKKEEFFYFANSFYLNPDYYTLAVTEYNIEIASVIKKNNFYGVQFHPEKSGDSGLKMLRNFTELV